jgi:hypothetical protein
MGADRESQLMGFELQHQRVTFGPDDLGGRYAGLEVVMNELSIGSLMMIESLADGDAEQRANSVVLLVRLLGQGDPENDPPTPPGIRSWNYTRDGAPVPICVGEVSGLGAGVVMRLIDEWQKQAQVDAPLNQPSSVGERSVAVSIPMETPSLSPETLRALASTSASSDDIPPTLSRLLAERQSP